MSDGNRRIHEVLIDALGSDVFDGRRVLDVGCGARFAQARDMRDMGARVTALDVVDRANVPEGIAFVRGDFREYRPEGPVDVLHMSNSPQFMPTEDVFRKIEAIAPGVIAIRTFSAYPTPNWEAPVLQSMYFTTGADWRKRFEPLGYDTLVAESYEHEGSDLMGTSRLFRLTDYIARKKSA